MNPHRAPKPVDEFDDSPIKHPSQLPKNSDGKTPHVMIVGAGIGGLFLAILLDKAGIPYEIYERSPEVRPLGSVMALNSNILGVLEQLDIYEDFKKISLPSKVFNLFYGDMKKIATLNTNDVEEAVGYDYRLFARPDFYALLQSRVPAEKIHFNKKVLSMQQNKEGVMIRCADGTTYHGDILVGADGAYSAVRQHLYRTLKDQGVLPESDKKDLSKGYICLVGVTCGLDPIKYPYVTNVDSVQHSVIGKGTRYTWTIFNVPGNRICWVAVAQLATLAEAELLKFRNSEWGPESNAEMIAECKDFKLPIGTTLGDLIDQTPKDKISRVFLEEKLFETWSHNRTVLIGDAAHKLLPSAGQGAVCAMQDAVILAGCLYDLPSLSPDSIRAALQDYQDQRYSHVKEQFGISKTNAIFLHGQTLSERLIRYAAFNLIPKAIKNKQSLRGAAYRPQVTFLPRAPKRGTVKEVPQKPSVRYAREQEESKKTAAVEATVPMPSAEAV
ncbi:hypothetical protein EMPS_07003 [Entomortierella parvispora]|uniref:FAD-binding domain-containing protein n=1 Tax=Entomortierella parvispora TaxID=205924 RepID=A0A9P3HDP4_9FUNG|nr:hypothetical protein EMPS_07003 [Entomortierella parvispora]